MKLLSLLLYLRLSPLTLCHSLFMRSGRAGSVDLNGASHDIVAG